MSYNKYDVQNELTDIYEVLDEALDKATDIMNTSVSDLDDLVNGRAISKYGSGREKGLVELIEEALNQIDDLKSRCEELPEEQEDE